MSRTGFTINERLSASDHSHRNRLRLFRKLDDFKNSNTDPNLTLNHTNLADILTSCGYSTSDFTAGNIKLSNITSVNQIPLKHHMTGSLIINQAHHQGDTNLIEINTTDSQGFPTGTFVLNAPKPGKGNTVELLTTNNLEQSGTTLTFGGTTTFTSTIDASNVLIKAKDISAGDISANNFYTLGGKFIGDINGNAATVTNGVYTTSSVTALIDVSSVGSGAIITTDERTKLTNIEAAADVTNATNVAAAGAVMNTGDENISGNKTFTKC